MQPSFYSILWCQYSCLFPSSYAKWCKDGRANDHMYNTHTYVQYTHISTVSAEILSALNCSAKLSILLHEQLLWTMLSMVVEKPTAKLFHLIFFFFSPRKHMLRAFYFYFLTTSNQEVATNPKG